MTKEQIDLIASSWEEISQDPNLVSNFYGKLFEIAPQTQKYFSTDLTKQSEKLAFTLSVVVGNIDRLENIKGTIEELGKKHRKMNIREEDYLHVKRALLHTIDGTMEMKSTDTINAWEEAITLISKLMVNTSK